MAIPLRSTVMFIQVKNRIYFGFPGDASGTAVLASCVHSSQNRKSATFAKPTSWQSLFSKE